MAARASKMSRVVLVVRIVQPFESVAEIGKFRLRHDEHGTRRERLVNGQQVDAARDGLVPGRAVVE